MIARSGFALNEERRPVNFADPLGLTGHMPPYGGTLINDSR